MDSILKSFNLQEHLCSKIWEHADTNNFEYIVMRPDVRKHLLDIAKDFVESFKIDDLEVEDVLSVGSLANYNWSSYSDVDLHVLIDKSKISENRKVADELCDAKKEIFNLKRNIKIKDFDVELYAQDVSEELDSQGKYSVLYNRWDSEPERSEFTLDKDLILLKIKDFGKQLEIVAAMPNSQRKVVAIDGLKDKIRNYRKSGLKVGGELSNENLVFKYLRRSGYMEKLVNLKKETSDNLLSLEQKEL